jgi:methylaspartate mutase epsilon subunit
MKLENRKWTEDEFFEMRKNVLRQWRTGEELEDISEGMEYCKRLLSTKNVYLRLMRAKELGVIQLLPQVGHGTLEYTLEHIQFVEPTKPDIWQLYSDAYTRKNKYDQAQIGIERCNEEGFSVLSGYPIVNYGVRGTRRVVESTDAGFFYNASDADARLAVEIALASGITFWCEHAIQEQFQHAKDFPMDKRIQYSQYTSRLGAYYEEHGVPIIIADPVNLSGWDHPAFKVTLQILQGLIAIEQGIKHIWLSIGLSMCLIQDVAAIQAGLKLLKEYAGRFGHHEIDIHSRLFPWLGVWPMDPGQAAAMVAWNATIGVMGGFDAMIVKSINEASATPTKEGNLEAMKICRQLINVMGKHRLPDNAELNLEKEMIEKEARACVDRTIEMGGGDVAVGIIRAIDAGVLDTIYSPWVPVKKNVLVVRDSHDAIRYLKHGNLPLPRDVIEYNREKIAEREKKEGIKADVGMVIADTIFSGRHYSELIPKY